MTVDICLTAEEASEAKRMLRRELQDAHTELHHTRNLDYRRGVQHRLDVLEHLLDTLNHATHEAYEEATVV